MSIPAIKPGDENSLKKWIGELCKRVFSHGFQLFESGKLTEKKTKVYCSENLLFYIIQVMRKNRLGNSFAQSINKWLEEQFGYLLLKYPQSEELEMSMSLAGAITEVDNFSMNDNDLVWRSGVKFEYSADGNYNKSIM